MRTSRASSSRNSAPRSAGAVQTRELRGSFCPPPHARRHIERGRRPVENVASLVAPLLPFRTESHPSGEHDDARLAAGLVTFESRTRGEAVDIEADVGQPADPA